MRRWIQERSRRLIGAALATGVLLAAGDGLVDARIRAQAGEAPQPAVQAPAGDGMQLAGPIASAGHAAPDMGRAGASVSTGFHTRGGRR